MRCAGEESEDDGKIGGAMGGRSASRKDGFGRGKGGVNDRLL